MESKSTGSREHGAKKTREQGANEGNLRSREQKILGLVSKEPTQFLGFFFASLRSVNFLTPILLSTTSTSHILTCPYFLIFRQFREQMNEISGSSDMAKIILGAHKVNLGSSDRENLPSRQLTVHWQPTMLKLHKNSSFTPPESQNCLVGREWGADGQSLNRMGSRGPPLESLGTDQDVLTWTKMHTLSISLSGWKDFLKSTNGCQTTVYHCALWTVKNLFSTFSCC